MFKILPAQLYCDVDIISARNINGIVKRPIFMAKTNAVIVDGSWRNFWICN